MALSFNKIMVTLDGSDLASQALPAAAAVADRFGAELVLFQVLHDLKRKTDLGLMADDEKTVTAGIERRESAMVDEAVATLRRVADTLELSPDQVTVIVEVGDVKQRIIERAITDGVDMIVMCTHGRTGLSRQLRGSVAEHVLHHANCPVLLVRANLPK